MSNSKEIIQGLMKFQYKYQGCGHVSCSSCGAKGSKDFDEGRDLSKYEPCSPNCPWEKARVFIKDKS